MVVEVERPLSFVIVTGLSGAGKSEALRCFEDLGYFAVDNLPPTFLPRFAELLSLPGSTIDRVAAVCDVRGGEFFDALYEALHELKARSAEYRIVYLEASDDVLIKRFKETRRRHPLALEATVSEGIAEERVLMAKVSEIADVHIDTSTMAAAELRDNIRTRFGSEVRKGLLVTVASFGYKYGVPLDADLVIDVRFLPNPHYDEKLRPLTGNDPRVKEFVLGRKETSSFLKRFNALLDFLMPHYVAEGKSHLTVAMGCTGGVHRSVAIAEETAHHLRQKGYNVILRHRDVGRSG